MVFSSPVFLFLFLPVVFFVYKLMPTPAKNYLLIMASLFFYAWGEPVYIILMLVSILMNYLLARAIGTNLGNKPAAKMWLALCIILNIGMLFVFKYAGFFVSNVNGFFGASLATPVVKLPVGISFYTFHAISYVVDVYRGISKAQKNLGNILLYISFFPQLIAGPIIKYHDIDLQIQSRTETTEKTVAGIKRFTVGLAKKLLIADAMGSLADQVFALAPADVNMDVAWLGALTYAAQIYFDFSGYSDMAIGLAKLFGFEVKENFDYPFTAQSIKVFWRKWHISLSTWFKEYLYIPLGGNRKGTAKTAINLLVVFFCTGLWHGAEWTFVVWGMLHGFFLMIERVGAIKPDKWPKWLASFYTLLVAVTAFTIFRSDTISQGFDFIAKMFTGFSTSIGAQAFINRTVTAKLVVLGIVAAFGSTPAVKNIYYKLKQKIKNSTAFEAGTMAVSLALLAVCILAVSGSTYSPFIYFRF